MIAQLDAGGGTVAETLTVKHPRWPEFRVKLSHGLATGGTGCVHDHRHATAVLEKMGMDAESSLKSLRSGGGFCDCEILMNCGYE